MYDKFDIMDRVLRGRVVVRLAVILARAACCALIWFACALIGNAQITYTIYGSSGQYFCVSDASGAYGFIGANYAPGNGDCSPKNGLNNYSPGADGCYNGCLGGFNYPGDFPVTETTCAGTAGPPLWPVGGGGGPLTNSPPPPLWTNYTATVNLNNGGSSWVQFQIDITLANGQVITGNWVTFAPGEEQTVTISENQPFTYQVYCQPLSGQYGGGEGPPILAGGGTGSPGGTGGGTGGGSPPTTTGPIPQPPQYNPPGTNSPIPTPSPGPPVGPTTNQPPLYIDVAAIIADADQNRMLEVQAINALQTNQGSMYFTNELTLAQMTNYLGELGISNVLNTNNAYTVWLPFASQMQAAGQLFVSTSSVTIASISNLNPYEYTAELSNFDDTYTTNTAGFLTMAIPNGLDIVGGSRMVGGGSGSYAPSSFNYVDLNPRHNVIYQTASLVVRSLVTFLLVWRFAWDTWDYLVFISVVPWFGREARGNTSVSAAPLGVGVTSSTASTLVAAMIITFAIYAVPVFAVGIWNLITSSITTYVLAGMAHGPMSVLVNSMAGSTGVFVYNYFVWGLKCLMDFYPVVLTGTIIVDYVLIRVSGLAVLYGVLTLIKWVAI